MDKVKYYLGLALAIITGAFLFERSRRKSAEAVADNSEKLEEVTKLDQQKASNDGQLQSEEVKREEIKKETEDAKKDDSGDLADYFNKRK